MNTYDDKWEQQINALLDGELNDAESEELKSAAEADVELARKIVEAYQLQRLMAELPQERAPASLTKRLLAVPAEQKAAHKAEHGQVKRKGSLFGWVQPRWVMAVAAVPLAIVAFYSMQPEQPSADEIAQARYELAIAFAYLDKASQITTREIESQVGDTMSDAITGSLIRNIKSQYELSKENKA